MGNAGINPPRERLAPPSPIKEGEAFVWSKPEKRDSIGEIKAKITRPKVRRSSLREDDKSTNDDDDNYFPKNRSKDDMEFTSGRSRPRSNTVSEGTKIPDSRKVLPTVFKWEGGGKQVYISGTFTEWKTVPMVKSHGDFVTIIDLPEGEHQYKFCVDGEWKHDPSLKLVDNGMGSKNNLVSVKNTDFEVFQALATDSLSVNANIQREYSQDIPQSKPWDKVSGPPILPPHLLQVILNKDTPLSCEPTLLPEPNHVMLNHLYALSIKDGVMVLSATHRYRKKYVTTLLYKPI